MIRKPAGFLSIIGIVAATAAMSPPDDPGSTGTPATIAGVPNVDDESRALEFVREHHPELAGLLKRLKAMSPSAYRKAVEELTKVSQALASLKSRDPLRHEIALEAWKAKSRVDLLAAQVVSQSRPDPGLRTRLKEALVDQIDAEARRLESDRAQTEARLARLRENLARLERDRDEVVEQRLQRILRQSRTLSKRSASAEASAPNAATGPRRPTEENPR